jgi:hypothetical protein
LNDLVVLAGSAAVVLLMIGIAAALGFRQSVKLDEAAIASLAEGALVEAVVIAPNGRAALARLAGDKLMIARAMGADTSARISLASAARVRLKGEKLSVEFADVGYPPLHMRAPGAPPWLAALAAGDRP